MTELLFSKYKHGGMIQRMLNGMPSGFMSEKEKLVCQRQILDEFGEQMDRDIEAGIKNGYSCEEQEILINKLKLF